MIEELWEGRVDGVEGKGFYASLYPLLDVHEGPSQAFIKIGETGFKQEDVIPGKVFYWAIVLSKGKAYTSFAWKKLGTYTRSEIIQARREADMLLARIKWHQRADRTAEIRGQGAT